MKHSIKSSVKRIKLSAVILSLSLASQGLLADEPITYKNKRGSLLELHFNPNNELTGTFTTAVASKECKDVIGAKQPIIGYADGSAISLSVNYPSCGSIVTLIGHINTNKDRMDIIALIAHQQSLFDKGAGTETITQDTFVKVK